MRLVENFLHGQQLDDSTGSGSDLAVMRAGIIPNDLLKRYRFQEWNHAAAILAGDFPEQWGEVTGCLRHFCLKKSAVVVGGA